MGLNSFKGKKLISVTSKQQHHLEIIPEGGDDAVKRSHKGAPKPQLEATDINKKANGVATDQ